MSRIELPDGGWAELRDIDTISKGERDRVVRLYQTTDDNVEAAMLVSDEMVKILVTSWSLENPLPSQEPQVIERLPFKVFDALANVALAMLPDLVPDFGPNPDPKVTAPSGS